MNYYLSLDIGEKTIGLATSKGIIAVNQGVIKFAKNHFNLAINKLIIFLKKEKTTHIIVGFPKNMNNTIGYRAKMVLNFIQKLKIKLNNNKIIIELIDERLTTKISHQIMIESNLSRKKRKEKKDGLSAQLILETYLTKIQNF